MTTTVNSTPLCPSSSSDAPDGVIFGIAGGSAHAPRVLYLRRTFPLDAAARDRAAPADPTEVFRVSATCAETECQHFNGTDCELIRSIISTREPVVDDLPACPIRSGCRWWQQEGSEACHRCPAVVTQVGAELE